MGGMDFEVEEEAAPAREAPLRTQSGGNSESSFHGNGAHLVLLGAVWQIFPYLGLLRMLFVVFIA